MTTVLEALRAASDLVATGSFDLDPARAREKLARYQLVDPHHYVLQIVQAAILGGATRIDFRIDSDEVEVRFDGTQPSADELSELYLYAFGKRGIDRLEALRHLALAVIAAEAVDPATVEVCGSETHLMIVDGEETLQPCEHDTHATTRVRVREKVRLAHVWEFVRSFGTDFAEVVALQQARFATAELRVNGQQVNREIEPPSSVRARARVSGPFEEGWLWVGSAEDTIAVVQHGVVIEEVATTIGDLAIAGVVRSRRLSTNLSQSSFVRNHAWDEFWNEAIMPAALAAADLYLQRVLRESNRGLLQAVVAEALRCRAALVASNVEVPAAVDEVVMRHGDVEIWHRLPTRASSARWVTTRDLFASIGEGEIPFVEREYEIEVLRSRHGTLVEHVLLAPRDPTHLGPELLAKATGRTLYDYTEKLREDRRLKLAATEVALRLEGIAGEWPHRLRTSDFVATARAQDDELAVEIGWEPALISDATRVIAVPTEDDVERLVQTIALSESAAILVTDLLRRDFPASELVRRAGPVIAAAIVNLVLADKRLRSDDRPRALAILAAIARNDVLRLVCQSLGWTESEVDDIDRTYDSLHDLQTLAQCSPGEERLAHLGGLATTPLFRSVRQGMVSLQNLVQTDEVQFVGGEHRHSALQIEWEVETTSTGRVVWLDAIEQEIVAWALGEGRLVDVRDQLRVASARVTRQRAGFAETATLHGNFIETRALTGPHLSGEVGLSRIEGDGWIELVLLHESRRIAHRVLDVPMGQFRAIVEDEQLTPTADLGNVVEDAAFAALTRRLEAVCHDLFEQWCLTQLDDPHDHRVELTLWRAVALASDSKESHRLDWPVFSLCDERRVSIRQLRAEVGDELLFDPTEGDALAIKLPVAPQAHLDLLQELLPGVRIRRDVRSHTTPVIERPVTQTAGPSRGDTTSPSSRYATLEDWLLSAGIQARVEERDGVGAPKLVGGVLELPRDGRLSRALRQRPDEIRTVIAVCVAAVAPHPRLLELLAARLCVSSTGASGT